MLFYIGINQYKDYFYPIDLFPFPTLSILQMKFLTALLLLVSLNVSYGQNYDDHIQLAFLDESHSSYLQDNQPYLPVSVVPTANIISDDAFPIHEDSIGMAVVFEGNIIEADVFSISEVLLDSLYNPGILYHKGYQDGRLFYKNRGTFWGAFGIGFIAPYTYLLPSLVAGGIMAAVPPNDRNLRYHDKRMLHFHTNTSLEETNELFNDINYSRGYQKGAHNRKAGSVAGGVGAGVGVSILVVILIYASLLSSF